MDCFTAFAMTKGFTAIVMMGYEAILPACRSRLCEVRNNPVYAYGLLHSVRNDGGRQAGRIAPLRTVLRIKKSASVVYL
jgi:hypothetical protein